MKGYCGAAFDEIAFVHRIKIETGSNLRCTEIILFENKQINRWGRNYQRLPAESFANSQSKNKGEAHQDKKERTHLNLYCGAFEGIVQHWQHFSANIVSRGFL